MAKYYNFDCAATQGSQEMLAHVNSTLEKAIQSFDRSLSMMRSCDTFSLALACTYDLYTHASHPARTHRATHARTIPKRWRHALTHTHHALASTHHTFTHSHQVLTRTFYTFFDYAFIRHVVFTRIHKKINFHEYQRNTVHMAHRKCLHMAKRSSGSCMLQRLLAFLDTFLVKINLIEYQRNIACSTS